MFQVTYDDTHTFQCNQALTGNPYLAQTPVSHIVLLEVTSVDMQEVSKKCSKINDTIFV